MEAAAGENRAVSIDEKLLKEIERQVSIILAKATQAIVAVVITKLADPAAVGFKEIEFTPPESMPSEVVLKEPLEGIVWSTVATVDTRIQNAIRGGGLKCIGQLATITEEQWRRTDNIGSKSIRAIKDRLADCGLWMGMKLPGWEPPTVVLPEHAWRRFGWMRYESIANEPSCNFLDGGTE